MLDPLYNKKAYVL